MRQLTMLDCFCGLGGASEGFAKEGFNCTGIDIVNVGYPYRFILSDMQVLDGKDFRGYDVIWGSPPCRDFSQVNTNGKVWKIGGKTKNMNEISLSVPAKDSKSKELSARNPAPDKDIADQVRRCNCSHCRWILRKVGEKSE